MDEFLEVYDDQLIEITWREYFNDAVKKSENARRAALIGQEKKKRQLGDITKQMFSKLKP